MTRVILSVVCALLTISATSGLPQSDLDHDQWLQERYFEAISIKEGMTRAELLKIFRMDGGLQLLLPTRYVLKSSSLIKVDVEFDVPTGSKVLPEDLRFEMDLLNESYKYQFVSSDKLKIARIELPNVAGRAEGTEYEARVWHGPLTMMVSRRLVHSRKTM